MSLQHLPGAASAEDVLAALTKDGAVIVDQLVDDACIDAIIDEMAPYIDATPVGEKAIFDDFTQRTGGLVARSATARALITHPLILESAKRLLCKATSFQLHLTQIISLRPGGQPQAVHRDQWGWDFFPFPADYEPMFQTIWAATDFTDDNGATRVVPGSHRNAENFSEFKQDETEPAVMRKGSVLIYSGKVYHGGGANQSSDVRRGINITYSAGWLRQEENQYLSVPIEIARTLPTDLLRLIGYRRGSFGIGYVDDLRDPIAVVRPEEAVTGFGDLNELERVQTETGAPRH
jgi:ectoine hydroxylase-related dioxygenase (phytanoyl-CoA dioxygenase family)